MMRPARLFPALFPPLLLVACGDAGTGYPALIPAEFILAEPALPDHAGAGATDPAAASGPALSRAGSLSDRADALRGPVIDPATRARMEAAAARHRIARSRGGA